MHLPLLPSHIFSLLLFANQVHHLDLAPFENFSAKAKISPPLQACSFGNGLDQMFFGGDQWSYSSH